MNCPHEKKDQYDEMHQHLKQHLLKYVKNEDIQGMELSSLIRILANFYSAAIAQKAGSGDLSGPRMGILLRLMIADESGSSSGISPTQLSHFQHVKKNTISSLLRGLEESGLIERLPDPQDRRAFLIHITQKGKLLVKTVGPERLKMMNDLASDLTNEEKKQLISLLDKLRRSMRDRVDISFSQVMSESNSPIDD